MYITGRNKITSTRLTNVLLAIIAACLLIITISETRKLLISDATAQGEQKAMTETVIYGCYKAVPSGCSHVPVHVDEYGNLITTVLKNK